MSNPDNPNGSAAAEPKKAFNLTTNVRKTFDDKYIIEVNDGDGQGSKEFIADTKTQLKTFLGKVTGGLLDGLA